MRIRILHSVLAAPSDDESLKNARKSMRQALLRGESVVVSSGGHLTLPNEASESPTAERPTIVVPQGKLAT